MHPHPSTILVVEKHPLMREALCTAIEEEQEKGLVILAALEDSTQALEQAPDLKPDIILLAVGNPGQEDLQALITLRQTLPQTSLVALLTDEMLDHEQAAWDIGAHVLTKSASRAELMLALQHLSMDE